MACVFCEIVQGIRSAYTVYQDETSVAFLDHRPLFPGHVLVVPRQHIETLGAMPAAHVEPLFDVVRRLAIAVESAMAAQGTFVALNNRVSQSVPHLHVHVVPRTMGDGLRGFFWPRHPYRDQQHKEETRNRIAAAVTATE